MFGKPQWFRKKSQGWGLVGRGLVGWGLVPACWQGWLYAGAWGAVVAIPCVGLLVSERAVEALIWGTVALGAYLLDVRQVFRAMNPVASDDVLVIDDDRAGSQLNTRRFDLRLRD